MEKEAVNTNIEEALQEIENGLDDVVKEENDDPNKEKNKINDLIQENNQLKDKFVRTFAELENTRRIAREEKEKSIKYSVSNFANELIPVMENFYLAFSHQEKEKKENIFFDGITLVFNELKKVFEKNNLKRIFPLNEKFDPNFHQAVSYVESDYEEDEIIEVLQAGYVIYDRVLKPAMVVVSKNIK